MNLSNLLLTPNQSEMLGLMSDSICRKDSSRPVGRQLLVGAVPIPTRCALLGTNKNTNTITNTNPVKTQRLGTMEWAPSCRLFSFKYTVPHIVSAIEVAAFFCTHLTFPNDLVS